MDTCFQSLELNGLGSGNRQVPLQVAMIEEHNGLEREIRETLVQELAGILPRLEGQPELQDVDLQGATAGAKAFCDLVGQSAALRRLSIRLTLSPPRKLRC